MGPFLCEALEKRFLRASATTYSISDYFPTAAGNTWHYNGFHDGYGILIDRTSFASTYGGQPALLFGDNISYDPEFIKGREFYRVDSTGLHALESDANSNVNGTLVSTYTAPQEISGSASKPGDVSTWSGRGLTRVFNRTDNDAYPIKLSGTDDGSSTNDGIDTVQLIDGQFVGALKVEVHHTITMSGKDNKRRGVTFHETIDDTFWFTRGIGIVREMSSIDETITVGSNEPVDQHHDDDITLETSNLLPVIKVDQGGDGTVTITGTDGPDSITLALNKSQKEIEIIEGDVYRQVGGYQNGIQVLAGGGNDRVTVAPSLSQGVYIDAGAGNDSVTGGVGADTITGGAGKDSLDGAAGDDRLNGSAHNDLLIGGEGNDRLYGGDGNDVLQGGGGVDRIYAGAGDDFLDGGGSNDKLYGEAGNDILYGGTQNDLLNGGEGSDTFFGGDGDDSLYAVDSTPDNLDGGPGNDTAQHDNADLLANI